MKHPYLPEPASDGVMFITPETLMAMANVIEKARELVKTNPKIDLPINHNEIRLELVQALHLLDSHGELQ